jgi:hypothetical protein
MSRVFQNREKEKKTETHAKQQNPFTEIIFFRFKP